MAAIDGLAALIGLDIDIGKQCESCDKVIDPEQYEIGPLYECSNCGQTFTRETSADRSSHRCPECKKFGTKIQEEGCPECGEGFLVDAYVVECPWCEKSIDVDNFDDHITCEG